MKILITGASGFIGGFIVEKALDEGHEVIAAIRKTSSKKYLTDTRIEFLELNISDKNILSQQISEYIEKHGSIDAVIHNAGITKALDKREFEKVNFSFTKNIIEVFQESENTLSKFVYISSLASIGPGNQTKDTFIKIDDKPFPVTAYGRSKLKTEQYLKSLDNFPYIIIRPPAVFGPRDGDMFEAFNLINKKLEIFIGGKTQNLSFVYVKDLATGIIMLVSSELSKKTYFVSDPNKYTSTIFNNLVKKSMGKRTIVIKLPIFFVYIAAFFAEMFGKIINKPSTLYVERINELKSTNWLCDTSSFVADTGFTPQYSLEEAVQETTEWYKENNWL